MTDNGPQIGLVLDCADPETLAEFWAPALGYVNLGTAGAYVALFPDGRPGPKLLLQRVPEPKAVKNRMHVDIEVADIARRSGSRSSPSAPPGSAKRPAASTAPRGSS